MPSLFLHLLVLSLASFCAYLGVLENRHSKAATFRINGHYIISFILVAFFIASREYLGRDWDGYYRIYNEVQQDFSFGETREFGFTILVRFLNYAGLEFQSFIIVSSILTVFLFYRAFKRNYNLLPLAIIFFFLGLGYTSIINIIRQGVALFCFLNALMYIDEGVKGSFKKYLVFIVLGALFHYSILLALPFYWIAKLKIKPWQLLSIAIGIFAFCFFYLMNIYGDLIAFIPKYQHYTDADYIFASDSTFGLGAILLLVLRVLPVLFMSPIIRRYPESNKYFILYVIGICIYYSFYKLLIITRFTFYMQFCELFVFSYFVLFLWNSRDLFKKIFALSYIGLFFFNFIYLFKDFLNDQLCQHDFSIMFMNFHF